MKKRVTNKMRFAASTESIPLFHNLNDFLRKKYKEGIPFAVWILEIPGEGPIVHSTAFPKFRPKESLPDYLPK